MIVANGWPSLRRSAAMPLLLTLLAAEIGLTLWFALITDRLPDPLHALKLSDLVLHGSAFFVLTVTTGLVL